MASTREHEQDCSRPENADRPENCLDEDDELEGIREDLYKGMQGSWEEVANMYKQNPRVSKVKFDNIIGNTALHLAVLGGKIDVVRNLVDAINETCQDPAEVLSTPNKYGNTPLHLAAYIGSIEMCECIIGEKHIYKHLLGIRSSSDSFTPLHVAAECGNKEAFFWLSEICESTAKVQDYCKAGDGTTVLHTAIQLGHWDLAFQIIHKHESLMDAVDDRGHSPIHVLAEKPTAFRSGIYLSFLDSIIYPCIPVKELIPDSCKEKTKLGRVRHPNNFFQKPRLSIKFSETSGGSTQKSTGQFDAENLEEGQGHHPSNGAKGHQGFPSRSCSRYLSFIKLIASQILLIIFSIILGPSKSTKLKEIKEKHIWSLQIMNKLVDRAKEYETMNHSYRTRSSCRSAYRYFRRGRAEITPIILAAKNGVLEMVVKILEAFPMTILDADSQENSIALVAVGNQQFHVYDFLIGYNHVVERDLVFNVVDCNGNTALHLAAMPHEYESWLMPSSIFLLQWKVKWYEYVKNSLPSECFLRPNNSGLFPDQIFTEMHKELLDRVKNGLKSIGDSCSFVAALVATVAFASSATVPGGVDQDTGRPLFQNYYAFIFFALSSLLALCSSFTSLLVFFTLLTSKYQFKDFRRSLPLSLFLGLTCLLVSMVSMLVCFCSSHYLMLDPTLQYVAFPVYALTLFVVTYFFLQKFPSFFVLLKTVFQRVPGRIYREDPI